MVLQGGLTLTTKSLLMDETVLTSLTGPRQSQSPSSGTTVRTPGSSTSTSSGRQNIIYKYCRNLYAIPGLDYVAHEDILPYTTSETNPLQHELFDKFLSYQEDKDPPYAAQETLKAWQEKNHPWLELSDVHKETTENIRVTVIPFYMGFRHVQGLVNTSSSSGSWPPF